MENKKYLTEENYEKTNILLIIGLMLFIAGLILIISGFVGFGNQFTDGIKMGQEAINPGSIFSNIGGFAAGGFMAFSGLSLLVIGVLVKFFSKRREITAYTTQQTMPIIKEGIEEMAQQLEMLWKK